jgi:hypothetical protein
MKKTVLSLGLLSTLMFAQSNGNRFNLENYATSTLTAEVKDAIAYMGNEERLAYDIYQNLYNYHSDENSIKITQLKNISEKSEIKHIGIVRDLVNRYELSADDLSNVSTPSADRNTDVYDLPSGEYDIPAIQELYNTLYNKGVNSQREALEAGCMVEVTDINDLNYDITLAEASQAKDVVAAFTVLRDGSYNHYWAFDKGLKSLGVEDGCCSLGTISHVNYCQPNYPKNEQGHRAQSNNRTTDTNLRNGHGQGKGHKGSNKGWSKNSQETNVVSVNRRGTD